MPECMPGLVVVGKVAEPFARGGMAFGMLVACLFGTWAALVAVVPPSSPFVVPVGQIVAGWS